MRTNLEGIALIKSFESCELTSYKGLDNLWTIGWGRARGVAEGEIWTQVQADTALLEDLQDFERIILDRIYAQLTDNQLSALVSFVFNVGLGYKGIKDGFLVLKSGDPSSLLKFCRQGKWSMAAGEFPKWDKLGGAPCAGLLRRRMAEQTLFLKS